MTYETARKTVEEQLAQWSAKSRESGNENPDHALLISHERVLPYGWVFCYNMRGFIERGDFDLALLGNAPFFITQNGDIHHLPTGQKIETSLKLWEMDHNQRFLSKTFTQHEKASFVRCANTVLIQAIRGQSERVRLTPSSQFWGVFRNVEGWVWHDAAWQPSELFLNWLPFSVVAHRLREMAEVPQNSLFDADVEGHFTLRCEGRQFDVNAHFTAPARGDTLELKLREVTRIVSDL